MMKYVRYGMAGSKVNIYFYCAAMQLIYIYVLGLVFAVVECGTVTLVKIL